MVISLSLLEKLKGSGQQPESMQHVVQQQRLIMPGSRSVASQNYFTVNTEETDTAIIVLS